MEVLNLSERHKLIELPNSFGSLKKLKYLDSGDSGIGSLPEFVLTWSL